MADPTTIAESIEQSALDGVQSSSADGVSATAMDISKQIEADNFVAAKRARAKNHLGISLVQLEPGRAG